jgi:transposase
MAPEGRDYRLPSGREERQDLAAMIGQDGRRLFAFLEEDAAFAWTRNLPALETLRRVWVQQFYADEHVVCWREANDLPPSSLTICTPYDPEARFSRETLNDLDWLQSSPDGKLR